MGQRTNYARLRCDAASLFRQVSVRVTNTSSLRQEVMLLPAPLKFVLPVLDRIELCGAFPVPGASDFSSRPWTSLVHADPAAG